MIDSLNDKFNKLKEKFQNPNFRQNRRRGNEIGYYIFDYDPKDELIVRKKLVELAREINNSLEYYHIVIFDIYEIIINFLQENKIFDDVVNYEKELGYSVVLDNLQALLALDQKDNPIISNIKANIDENTIIFITGIGKAYPIIRSHRVLNNLQQQSNNVPVVLFFPGIYNGQELILFKDLKDDNYYRAFKL